MPQVITTILPDGNPKGLRIVEIANRPGKAFIVPRTKLTDLRTRGDAQHPGLYFLFGQGTDRSRVYIGQSENVISRLYAHDLSREEEEWDFALVFFGNLYNTLIKYLESVSIDLAKKADRYELFNSAAPHQNALNEAQHINAVEYLERIKLVMSLLGYTVFDVVSESIAGDKIYVLEADGADARAQLLEDGSLNVLKDSLARIRETEAFFGWSRAARRRFIEDGTFVSHKNGASYIFTKDVIFNSPTAAAATVTGRPINGWTAWKDEMGNTLDENIRK